MPKTNEIAPLGVSFDQAVKAVVQTGENSALSKTREGVVATLESSIAAFEGEYPDIVREMDLLGFEIDEYEAVLASTEPQLIKTTNTTLAHDVE